MVWVKVKSPSLLSDTLLPLGQAVCPRGARAPRPPRPCTDRCRSCPSPPDEVCSFWSVPVPSAWDSFLGHFPRNRKFFSRTQALQPEWRASRKRTQCFRSSAFTCGGRRGQVTVLQRQGTPAGWTGRPHQRTGVAAVSRREEGFAVRKLTFWWVKGGWKHHPLLKPGRSHVPSPFQASFQGSRELVVITIIITEVTIVSRSWALTGSPASPRPHYTAGTAIIPILQIRKLRP